jgi:cell division protein FtsL
LPLILRFMIEVGLAVVVLSITIDTRSFEVQQEITTIIYTIG